MFSAACARYTVSQADSDEERQRRRRAAKREFQILQALHHPGILPVSDYREHDHGPAAAVPLPRSARHPTGPLSGITLPSTAQ
ncbi:MAG UNVERIFIED_CONTAM: hypothetical protein LVR18_50930 [Planctomycetaceae bacterium]